jgi:hypothetical protein
MQLLTLILPRATFTLTSAGAIDAFIVKLILQEIFRGQKSFGSTSNDYGRCIITDGGNNLICAGTFNGTVDFDLNAGTFQ